MGLYYIQTSTLSTTESQQMRSTVEKFLVDNQTEEINFS